MVLITHLTAPFEVWPFFHNDSSTLYLRNSLNVREVRFSR